MFLDPSKMKLVETATLKRFAGDVQTDDHLEEVIVTRDGQVLAHWIKDRGDGPKSLAQILRYNEFLHEEAENGRV